MKKRILVGLMALFLVCAMGHVSPVAAAQALQWGTPQRIDGSNNDLGSYAELAVSGLNVVEVWQQDVYIYRNYSTDGGVTWGTPQRIDSITNAQLQYAERPQVAMDGLNVVAVWDQSDDGEVYNIYANYSTDGGETWGTPQIIDTSVFSCSDPDVAIYCGHVVAAWIQELPVDQRGSASVYVNYSSDGGQNWATPQPIQIGLGESSRPQIAMSKCATVVTWLMDRDVLANQSADYGQTWGTQQEISTGITNCNQQRIALDGSNAVVVWFASNGTSYYHLGTNYSLNGGQTWGTAQIIENASDDSYYPDVAVSCGRAITIWRQGMGFDILKSVSIDGGQNWDTPVSIKVGGGTADQTRIALRGATALAAWWQQESIYATLSLDGGTSWDTPVIIDDSSYTAYTPLVAILNDNQFVCTWKQSSATGWQIWANNALLPTPSSGGSSCFIATAAFGTPAAHQIDLLRKFRDTCLMSSLAGERFVAWYYRNSPVVAGYIQSHSMIRTLVRMSLYPLIVLSFLFLSGILPYAVFLICAISLRRRLKFGKS